MKLLRLTGAIWLVFGFLAIPAALQAADGATITYRRVFKGSSP